MLRFLIPITEYLKLDRLEEGAAGEKEGDRKRDLKVINTDDLEPFVTRAPRYPKTHTHSHKYTHTHIPAHTHMREEGRGGELKEIFL